MIEVGRVCVKIAGRDARKKCVVVEVLDKNYVTVDGQTRRRKVNMSHLEPLDKTLGIASGANHAAVVAAFKDLGIEIADRKSKKPAERPKQVRKQKQTDDKKKK
ncbi:50S ribosomal protein L14e [Candidatus Woesearchaeota archaeon]|nr:50S ribosomal protein L14e [Candidatus Woesearchaeota archaeon]